MGTGQPVLVPAWSRSPAWVRAVQGLRRVSTLERRRTGGEGALTRQRLVQPVRARPAGPAVAASLAPVSPLARGLPAARAWAHVPRERAGAGGSVICACSTLLPRATHLRTHVPPARQRLLAHPPTLPFDTLHRDLRMTLRKVMWGPHLLLWRQARTEVTGYRPRVSAANTALHHQLATGPALPLMAHARARMRARQAPTADPAAAACAVPAPTPTALLVSPIIRRLGP